MKKTTLPATSSSIFATLLVFVSSACCVGPLAVVFSFVGLSGSTMLAVENIFGPYRLYILGLTALFLGVGFYTSYRPEKEACEPGQVCAVPGNRALQRLLLWGATALMLVLLYFTYVHPNLDLWFGIY